MAARSSPGPVRKSTQGGSKGAIRLIEAQIASTRAAGSAGPSISGSGKIEGTEGTAVAASSPLCRNRSSESSASFISQMPMPSAPAARYASTSSANDCATVVTCEIEILTD